MEPREALLCHADCDTTTHYSAAEIAELRQAAHRIVSPCVVQAPTLMIVRKSRTGDGTVNLLLQIFPHPAFINDQIFLTFPWTVLNQRVLKVREIR